jgi:hypothetical protein
MFKTPVRVTFLVVLSLVECFGQFPRLSIPNPIKQLPIPSAPQAPSPGSKTGKTAMPTFERQVLLAAVKDRIKTENAIMEAPPNLDPGWHLMTPELHRKAISCRFRNCQIHGLTAK